MCKFYSAIVTKNGDLLHNQSLMSHEDIIDLFNLNDNNPNCDNFVRVEFSTDNYEDSVDIEKYELIVDEKSIPDWFEQYREYITSRLKDFVSKRIILTNQKILTDGLYVVGKDVVIDRLINGTIIYLFGTVQKVYAGGTVQEVNSGGTVQVVYSGGTVQEVNSGGTVQEVYAGGTVQKVRNGGIVQEVYGGTVQVVYYGGTVQEVYAGGTVQEVYAGGTVQKVCEGGTVQEVCEGGTVDGTKKILS